MSVINTPKEFDQTLYDVYDSKAKDVFIKYLKRKGAIEIEVDPFGKYGIDLKACYNGHELYFDTEVRINWKSGESFPFKTIHLPYRKKKYVDQFGLKVYFISFRMDYDAFIVIDSLALDRSLIKVVSNRFKSSGEYFYDIPLKLCKVVLIKDGE